MDPFRLLARQQLAGQSMIGVSGALGVGYGYFREPASPPMLTQQVKGTAGSSGSQGISGSSGSQGISGSSGSQGISGALTESYLGLPLWVWLLGAGAAYFAYFK